MLGFARIMRALDIAYIKEHIGTICRLNKAYSQGWKAGALVASYPYTYKEGQTA